jgi:hypothetical protein
MSAASKWKILRNAITLGSRSLVEPIYRHFLGRSKNRCDSKKKLVRKSEFAKNSKRESSLKRN